MKLILKKFVLLTMFAAILILVPFSSNINAQTSNEEITEKEKKEVKKFVDEFLKTLDKTKDLDKVPERFFVTDFKTRLAKNDDWFREAVESEFFNQLSESERYEANVSLINFLYLGMMCKVNPNV